MRFLLLTVGTLAALLTSCERATAAAGVELNAREAQLAKSLSNSVFDGYFTADPEPGKGAGDLPELKAERYTLGEVKKLESGLWLLPTRIQYGDHDVTLPIVLPIAWADDTAVIRVDQVGFPGLGSFSARVLIHDGRYAGYWLGTGHGGRLFGSIRPAEGAKPHPSETQPSETQPLEPRAADTPE